MTRLSILSSEQVQAVHEASLKILSEVGVVLDHKEGRSILMDSGARLINGRLQFPVDLVQKCLTQCPSQVVLKGRETVSSLGGEELHWHNLGGARDVYMPEQRQHRPAVVQDVRDATRLLDALSEVTTITPFFTPQDVPGPIMSLAMYRHALPFTTKVLHGPGVQNSIEVDYAVKMADVVGSAKENLSLSVSPVSPLIFPSNAVDAILAIARQGLVFAPLPCPTAGTTAPFSISGAVAQQNAEIIASIVLAQLVHPGLPIVYCGRLAMMEPRTGGSVWGGVELGLASAATVQVGHYYHLPVNVYGFSTNAHELDVQNGFERAFNAVIPALAGADELSGIGEMEAGVMGSYVQMVVDNEIAAGIKRVCRGVKVDEDSLAVDVIAQVMSESRNFLTQSHTVRYLRQGETLITHLAERNGWESWDNNDRQGMAERAQFEVDKLLSEHQITPLEDAQGKELDELLYAALLSLQENRNDH